MHWMLMPLRRYAEFSGRSRRKEYWMFFLGVILFYFVMTFLMMGVIGAGAMATEGGAGGVFAAMAGAGIVGIILLIAVLGLFIPSLAVGVRRLHDIDRTGWWMLAFYGPYLLGLVLAFAGAPEVAGILTLISLVGAVILLVFAFLPGTPGPNRYGPDPKGANEEVFA